MTPRAELVSTGAELLNGRTLNRHAQTLGLALETLGIPLSRETTVPDELEAIESAVRDALARADLVFVSGGLGPTVDDLTRDALARLCGCGIVTDPGALENMKTRYAAWGRTVSPLSERQAWVLDCATVLPNRVGLAPGERIDRPDGRVLFVLPGPPAEFRAVLEDHMLPWLRVRFPDARPAVERILLTTGLGESDIAERIDRAGVVPADLAVAYCAAVGRVEIRLRGTAGQAEAVERAAAGVRALLGETCFAEERVELEAVIGRLLLERGATLAVAESCTGGAIARRIVEVEGCSAYFLGGVVAYANASKIRDLNVDPKALEVEGAVSEVVARAMAEGVRERFQADYGLAVTGIAGPTGGTNEKPVGLVHMAAASAVATRAHHRVFTGARDRVIEASTQAALDVLRRLLIDREQAA